MVDWNGDCLFHYYNHHAYSFLGGGIGKRKGLLILRRKVWGFETLPRSHFMEYANELAIAFVVALTIMAIAYYFDGPDDDFWTA
jgi:hypothetical protein